MKKYIAVLVAVIIAVAYFYSTKEGTIPKTIDDHQNKPVLEKSISNEVFQFSDKKFATQKIKELTIANAQCKERNVDFGAQVDSIHQILIKTLEHELRNGKTERELFSYSSQYKTFYSGYDDLLLEAKMNIEKENFSYTNSIDVLNDWRGLSVINGFSEANISNIVQELKPFEGQSNSSNMNLALKGDVSKAEIYDLLSNNEGFNTYLESPLGVGGSSVLSPSILFVLTATRLDIDDFKHAVSLQSFTVNDVAIAMTNNMPFEYLELLIAQTPSIGDMPLVAQGRYDSYENLADLATSTHDLDLLKLLSNYDVQPTNEPGIITGLDIAIMHLSDRSGNPPDISSSDKYVDTINYLTKLGYRAHGGIFQRDNQTSRYFVAPNRRGFQSSKAQSPSLIKALNSVELLDQSYKIAQNSKDDSLVSKAIETIQIRKTALNDKSTSCSEIHKELLTEQGFVPSREAYALIKEIEKDEENIAERLHHIDPVLVNLWRQGIYSDNTNSSFVGMLHEQKYQQALEYSVSKPLTEYETNRLVYFLIVNTENILPIWNARIVHTPPSSLLSFTKFPYENWVLLMNEGFDFSVQDKHGNDFFIPAALTSPEVVQLLLDNGFSPENNEFGLDVLDWLLDKSYDKGRLHPSLSLFITEIEHLESNHYSRIARLKQFYPEEYNELIKINRELIVPEGTELNRFKLDIYQ